MNDLSLPKLNSPQLDVIVLGARSTEVDALQSEFELHHDAQETERLKDRIKGAGAGLPVYAFLSQDAKSGPKYVSTGVIECSEMGNILSAINTAYAIINYNPSLVIFSGIAGSLDQTKYRVGDVFFPRKVRTRSFQKLKTFAQDYSSFGASAKPELIEFVKGKIEVYDDTISVTNRAKDLLLNLNRTKNILNSQLEQIDIPSNWTSEYKIPSRKASIIDEEFAFSWNKVLSNKDYVAHLRNIIGNACTTVDMESYGFLKTIDKLRSANSPAHGIIIRSVSDFAENKELSDQDSKWRSLGLKNMSIATRYLIQDVFHYVF